MLYYHKSLNSSYGADDEDGAFVLNSQTIPPQGLNHIKREDLDNVVRFIVMPGCLRVMGGLWRARLCRYMAALLTSAISTEDAFGRAALRMAKRPDSMAFGSK